MYSINVPRINGQDSIVINIDTGKSYVFLGANGSGKTRLGVHIENQLVGNVHRISAHRSLVLNPNVQAIKFELAQNRLLYGYDNGNPANKISHRWRGNPAVSMLDDFSHVLTALYSEENRLAILHRQNHMNNPAAQPPVTKFDILKEVWSALLPHREIIVYDNDIKVRTKCGVGNEYSASELSDGERVLFYLTGQCLLVNNESIVIVDEPELHIHKAILQTVWNKLESVRSDCAFVYLTHDLEFAASRLGAAKYAVQSFEASPLGWAMEQLSEHTNIPESVVARVFGSRLPVLFVEGDESSLDYAIYKRLYSDRTVVPVGGCEQVVHSVVTFRNNKSLHRCHCCGIIDADNRGGLAIGALNINGVSVLNFSELENIISMPEVIKEFCLLMGFDLNDVSIRIDNIKQKIFNIARQNVEDYCIRIARRHIDSMVKSISLDSREISLLVSEFNGKINMIDPLSVYDSVKGNISKCISEGDYEGLLRVYDNKGMLAIIASELGFAKKKDFEEQFCRFVSLESGEELRKVLFSMLPMLLDFSCESWPS